MRTKHDRCCTSRLLGQPQQVSRTIGKSLLQKDLGDQDANKAALIAHPLRGKSAIKKRRDLPGPRLIQLLGSGRFHLWL
jgi:hypothetical protein